MVGQRPLKPLIGVRIPVPEQSEDLKSAPRLGEAFAGESLLPNK